MGSPVVNQLALSSIPLTDLVPRSCPHQSEPNRDSTIVGEKAAHCWSYLNMRRSRLARRRMMETILPARSSSEITRPLIHPYFPYQPASPQAVSLARRRLNHSPCSPSSSDRIFPSLLFTPRLWITLPPRASNRSMGRRGLLTIVTCGSSPGRQDVAKARWPTISPRSCRFPTLKVMM